MKILSWNCRGLGNPRAVRALLRLKNLENPQVLFLMETKLYEEEIQSLQFRCGFSSGLAVSCRRQGRERAGGIDIWWDDIMEFTINSYSLNHIQGEVRDQEEEGTWTLTGMYGFPEDNRKKDTWELLKNLSHSARERWICMGDINDTISLAERRGGNPRSFTQMQVGRDSIEECGLLDLGFNGYPFTWSNGRFGSENIQGRLDRAMALEDFINKFSPIKVNHLARFRSDHLTLAVCLEAFSANERKKKRHIFCFEEVGSRDDKCDRLIQQNWTKTGGSCEEKLAAMKYLDEEFKELRTNVIKKEIIATENKLKNDNLWDEAPSSIQAYKDLEREYVELLKKEETLWRQRSRATWLKDGDKNTKFFHGKVGQRRKTNEIKKIRGDDGRWWHNQENIVRVMVDYYAQLFATSNPSGIAQTCEDIQKKLSPKQADWCGRRFCHVEVKEAIDQMHPLKAPGPNRLPALFYQKYWHIVGQDVCKMVLSILNDDRSPESINKTFVAPIPKCKSPTSPKQFRPISLCNVIMKIVTKTIANRVKPILPDVIDGEQSAFVRGRLITDNALIAMECFHWLKKKTKGKKGMMALKLDMGKAYDKTEWEFIQEVLWASGFPQSITKTIMGCITTVSYQFLINGLPSQSIVPERGIRQGDPLSPYIFILCANILSGLVHKEAQNNNLHGIQVARGAPKITHLLFADDNLFFA